MRRKLARVGDVITYVFRGKKLTGTVIGKSSEYLKVKLDSPRELLEYEKQFPAYQNPMEDNVYLHGEYHIKEYGDGKKGM